MDMTHIARKTVLMLAWIAIVAGCRPGVPPAASISPTATLWQPAITLTPPGSPPTATLTASATPSPPTVTLTASATGSPSPLPGRTPTATRAQTPTRTQTPTPLPTLPVTPTLDLTQQEDKFTAWMADDSACPLPCWWGLNPGETTWPEADRILTYIGLLHSKFDPVRPTEGVTQYESGTGPVLGKAPIGSSISYWVMDGKLKAMKIESSTVYKPYDFQEIWKNYDLRRIMQSYGPPSRVWVSSSRYTQSKEVVYGLWLAYDQSGFLIAYWGWVWKNPVYHICPRLIKGGDLYAIRIWLQNPNDRTPLDRAWEKSYGSPDTRNYLKSIEEAAGITPQEFYELFMQEAKPACFDTPERIWP